MPYYRGKILKKLDLLGLGCVEIMARKDGHFQFLHRVPCDDHAAEAVHFESPPYISIEAAEAAARQKFKL